MLDEIAEVLRPGGIFLAADGDMFLWDENQDVIPLRAEGEPGFTWTSRLFHAMRDAMRARGPGVDESLQVYDWLQEQGPIWERIGRERMFVPLGPWKENMTEKEKYISGIMQQNFLRMVDSARPLLLSYGFFEETVDRWIANVKDEVQNMKHRYYIRWLFEWAVKPRQAN
ncbi:hypothetical protein M407DRAFT_207534 [Tulasnella calospora MUT 4182]|uniref:Methyltransferase type 11 domain-containing protein n=1 Tax=Tulasnella calospora MUT 4182 TaxID=1051891 RepID=A0A0C3Q7V9_9AGAM|nr:hypothetical protein M407DRAFT_207534 [Tulasnella calospora MUT 4182]